MRRLFVLFLLFPAVANAQDDERAGLFVEARQLPVVSQSMAVSIHASDAEVALRQTFLNDGPTLGQADYHLYVPVGGTMSGFGYYNGDEFFEAKLSEKTDAEARHQTAAAAGRTTGIMKQEGSIHTMSVFPLESGTLKRIATTLRMPVTRELGRSHLMLPVDRFVGQEAPSTTAVIDIRADEPIVDFGIDGASLIQVHRTERHIQIVIATTTPVDVWWREAGPALSIHATSVAIDEESTNAVDLRVVFNEGTTEAPKPIVAFVDGSGSMRRRARAVAAMLERLEQHTKLEVFVFAETIASVPRLAVADTLRRGTAGHVASYETMKATAKARCARTQCVLITDPALDGLELAGREELQIVLLADAHEFNHFDLKIPNGAVRYATDDGSAARLRELADKLVLPVLSLVSITQGELPVSVAGTPNRQVVQGGALRLVASTDRDTPISVVAKIGERTIERKVKIKKQTPSSDAGKRLRRDYFTHALAKQMVRYKAHPDATLKKQIVATSIREGVPTDLTALQVDAPAADPRPSAPIATRSTRGFGGSSTPEPAEWAAFLMLLALATWAARRHA